MAITYIPFTTRLKASSQEGIIAEAQQIAVSASDKTDIKSYVDQKVAAASATAFTFKGSVASIAALVTELNKGAKVGDFWNISAQFSLSGDANYNGTYPAGTTVAVRTSVAAGTTVTTSNVGAYIDPLGGVVNDMSNSVRYYAVDISKLPTESGDGTVASPSMSLVTTAKATWATMAQYMSQSGYKGKYILSVTNGTKLEFITKSEATYTSASNFSLKFEAFDKSYDISYGLNGATTYSIKVGKSRMAQIEELLTLA